MCWAQCCCVTATSMSTSIWQGPLGSPRVLALQNCKVPLVSKEVRFSVDHSLGFAGTRRIQNNAFSCSVKKIIFWNRKWREGISMKCSNISVTWKNVMRKNHFLIHSKPDCECMYCSMQIHITGLGIPLTHTPSDCLLVQTKLVQIVRGRTILRWWKHVWSD